MTSVMGRCRFVRKNTQYETEAQNSYAPGRPCDLLLYVGACYSELNYGNFCLIAEICFGLH
jgi:hypothetical protein